MTICKHRETILPILLPGRILFVANARRIERRDRRRKALLRTAKRPPNVPLVNLDEALEQRNDRREVPLFVAIVFVEVLGQCDVNLRSDHIQPRWGAIERRYASRAHSAYSGFS
jgi:hypothetical protein